MLDNQSLPVTAAYFEKPTIELAKSLLGMELVHDSTEGRTVGKIVEVEAYCGPEDKGAHSYGGLRTKRTDVMYGAPGNAYVYLIYGMYNCFNVVSGPIDKPEAILIRALEPLEGLSLMASRRTLQKKASDSWTLSEKKKLTSGPGRLAQAMDISKGHYGSCLWNSPLYIRNGSHSVDPSDISVGPRINIDYAEEAKEYPWRFWITESPFVSK